MEVSKTRQVSSPVVLSSIFLSVICFAGLIHVEMELYVHRQMIQVLNQQTEEKLELRSTAHEGKESVMKMPHRDIEKGKGSWQYLIMKLITTNVIYLKKAVAETRRKLKHDSRTIERCRVLSVWRKSVLTLNQYYCSF